jgi:glycosyltransferase involved in cell wall biosynthesis
MILAIIPAFNEADSIESVVLAVKNCVDEVVVVDDGSLDETASIASSAGATVLRHDVNRGQGAALETGHEYARSVGADFVLHFDADGQFDAGEIVPALEAIQTAKADVLFGSRFLDKKGDLPLSKRYIIFPISKVINSLFGTPNMSDVHNGFRILNKKALSAIYIEQDRMAHASEIPALVKKHGLLYIEFPVTVRYFEYGQNLKGGFHILKDLILGRFLH